MNTVKKSGKSLIITKCKYESCQAVIFWVKSKPGSEKRMPIDYASYKGPYGHDLVYDKSIMTPHWATCPGSDSFRKAKKANRFKPRAFQKLKKEGDPNAQKT